MIRTVEMDTSETAQVMAIDKTFTDLESSTDIRHPDPAKRDLRVVEVSL